MFQFFRTYIACHLHIGTEKSTRPFGTEIEKQFQIVGKNKNRRFYIRLGKKAV